MKKAARGGSGSKEGKEGNQRRWRRVKGGGLAESKAKKDAGDCEF